MTAAIENRVKRNIIATVSSRRYDQVPGQISGILVELHAGIPETKRTSYGIVYVVRVLSEYLYSQLVQAGLPVKEVAGCIFSRSDHTRPRSVALGMMACLGRSDLEDTVTSFEAAAASADWEMREMAQGLFRKVIAEHPAEVREYLVRLSVSPDQNLRRFVAETLRPVRENRWFHKRPEYPLSILRNMFKERSPYPRTSVGNNLSDLARSLPETVYGLVKELVDSGDDDSYWIAYRACRNLVRSDPARVMDILNTREYQYKKRLYRRSDYQRD